MDNRYILTLSNNHLYREVEIAAEQTVLSIGTLPSCDSRLRREDFFEPVNLILSKNKGNWAVACTDNLYISEGGIVKLMARPLKHGDVFDIRYQSSDQLVFHVEFQIDFTGNDLKYERSIDVSGSGTLRIGGGSDNDIVLASPFIRTDQVVLVRRPEGFVIQTDNSTYGVFRNGRKAAVGELIRDTDFFSVSDCFFYYRKDHFWTTRDGKVNAASLPVSDHPVPGTYPEFIRNTRLMTVIDEEKIEILDPPQKPQKPKGSIVTRLLPSVGMLVVSGVMMFFGGMMIAVSALSGVLAVITAVLGIREGKKDYETGTQEREVKYNAYIEKKRREIEEARAKELQDLDAIYISGDAEMKRFNTFSPNLFDRSRGDEDFLSVRLGEGRIEAKRVINYKKQERLEVEDELQNLPGKISEEYKYVENAPVIVDLKTDPAVGISGSESFRYNFLKKIVIDLVARQYHTDLRMVFIGSEEHQKQLEWLRFLPHAANPLTGARNIACDDESRNQIFEYLYNEMTGRTEKKSHDFNIVLFFYDECGFKSHPISKLVSNANEIGVTFLFFEERQDQLPQGCRHIIMPVGKNTASLSEAADRSKAVEFRYTTISDAQANAVAQLMAPVYTEELSLEGNLTRSITLFELLNILTVEDLDLEKRWKSAQASRTMTAPIGVSKTGVVSLDLHDKAHGPHGLVAGTTGSGKSELIQTYILSMATLYHPYEVGFVIIDFKGGGMANQFRDLPHLIGTITNIDGKEIDRSLKSIKAELQKRQRLFAEADVNHIDKYIRKYKAGEAKTPLPHLIIIVDEFAELKSEQPDFMKELISAARIGRSLGVHLILATQKPAGVVDDQIWSNSRFKMCLKVQGTEDSNEVLKSPLAAEIKEPGRAYLQVGNNEIFELFQSAYSGAPERADDSRIREFTIYEVDANGRNRIAYQQKKPKAEEGASTQLDAIVRHVADYADKNHIDRLPPICLPSLEHRILFPESKLARGNGIVADIGIYDDPDRQEQNRWSVNLTEENVMLIGSSQSGKTNLLQTMIRSMATEYTPEQVNIYILDFASMFLKSYETLAHVGGVVTPAEDEKLKNLFKLIQVEMQRRRERLLEVGVSSFASYLEAGFEDLPQIVLMIDNMTALKELYFQDDDELIGVCREGLSLGITVVLSNTVTTGIGFRYLSNFSCRIALFNNDSSEYTSIFDHCRERLDDIPGRALIEIEKEHYECQTYLAFEGEREIDRVESIRSYIAERNAEFEGRRAKQIPAIPDHLTESYIADNYEIFLERFELPLGLSYATVQPEMLKLARLGSPLTVTGREGMGQDDFLRYLISSLDSVWDQETEVYIIDNMTKQLESLQNLDNVVYYSMLHSKVTDVIRTVNDELQKRYDTLAEGGEIDLDKLPMLVVLINNRDALATLSADYSALDLYKNIITRLKGMNVCVILGDFENTVVNYNSPEVLKMARDAGHFLVFEDLNQFKVIDLPLSLIRENKKRIVFGDSYYIR
ncbi:MAG: type VII secretion protein EssC, partial [Mogibacterium sp.]|nr:type VII secretion protein EssC [Mogibacterium sp.]